MKEQTAAGGILGLKGRIGRMTGAGHGVGRRIALAAGMMLCMALAATRAFSERPADRAAQGSGLSGPERAVCERIRIHPQCPRAHLAYAQLLAQLGRNGEAKRELGEAQRLEPGLSFAPPATLDELARKLGMTEQLAKRKQTRSHF
ncbi:MAG TPA: hypothetical protein VMV27_02590 [Candidatus Binataceae bacterium]|nr:hypothetical protein [Candidatus Binataceae bacterium]